MLLCRFSKKLSLASDRISDIRYQDIRYLEFLAAPKTKKSPHTLRARLIQVGDPKNIKMFNSSGAVVRATAPAGSLLSYNVSTGCGRSGRQ
jgi:hypothetical protein